MAERALRVRVRRDDPGIWPGQTLLVGDVRDQAHLYRLLDVIRDFGLELLVVKPAEISDGGKAIGSQTDRPY
jgi:hypothetical protein